MKRLITPLHVLLSVFFLLGVLGIPKLLGAHAGENCTTGVNCTIVGNEKHCTKEVTFPVSVANISTAPFVVGSTNVINCNITVTMSTPNRLFFRYFAKAATNETMTNRSCSFLVVFTNHPNHTCIIDTADGLPVELMDFAVDEGASTDGR